MKKQIFKIFVFICLLFGLVPSMALADETYNVTISARHNNRALSYVTVMISQNDETITYENTDRNGVATFNLPDGDYTATIGYVSGNYSYYGTVNFTVEGRNTSAVVNVDSEFSWSAAESIYNRTTYYDHVDIRVKGTFTTGTAGNLVTHSITLRNVELLVKDGDTTLIDTKFTDNTESYEWRVTGKEIPNTAVVSLIFDIVLDGEVVREDYVTSFSGKDEFIQAIINCDMNQGLDFIIDPTEIVSAALYDVQYVWRGLPDGLAVLPETTEYAPNATHIIDTQYKIGDIVVDEANRVMYTFSGWEEWSNAEDNHVTKNDIGTNTSIIVTEDTIIYGVWVSSPLAPTSNHIIIKKVFSGNDLRIPENLLFKVTDQNTTETYIIEIALSSFTYDSNTGIYSYELPIYEAGTYIIEELNYILPGYTFDTVNSSETIQEVTTDLTEEVIVTFTNVYTKNRGIDFHNSGFIVEKADADNRDSLSGAVFTLTDSLGNVVSSVTTDDSGYAIFMNLLEGTYTLKETKAPNGYHLDATEYKVVVTLISSYEVYSATQNAYLMQYEYSVVITPNDHYNSDGNRLTVYNEKIVGSLTIEKNFGSNSVFGKDNFSGDIEVSITGPDNYSQTVTLNKDNNWTITIDNLVLGKYTIGEVISNANIDGYTLNVVYTNGNVVRNDLIELNLTDNDYDSEIEITNTYTKIPEDIHNDASFSVKKVDKDGNVLSGAVFGLYDLEGNLISSKTTDKNGVVTFTGFNTNATYILKEISAPTNYKKVDTEWRINIVLEGGMPSTETGDNVYNWIVTIDNENYKNDILNVVNEKLVGSLTISKEVILLSNGEVVEKTNDVKEVKYSFTVIIGNDTYEVELSDGESKTFEGIPYGTRYQVIENIPSDAEWIHAVPENATGMIGTILTDVDMVNVYNINNGYGEEDKDDDNTDEENPDNNDGNNNNVPQTGIDNNIYLYSIITLLGMIGLIITKYRYNKNN